MKKFVILIVFITLITSINAFTQEPTVNNPQVIMQFIEKSPIMYGLHELKDTILPPDRSKILVENKFRRIKDENSFLVMEYDELIYNDNIFKSAIRNFSEQKYENALKDYIELFQKYPDFTKALTYQGICLIKTGKSDDAIDLLRQSISENFIDYEAHYYLAGIYESMDLMDVAVRYITISNILNRNDLVIQNKLKEIFKKKGIKFADWSFVPQIKYESSRDEVQIYTKPHYEGYAWVDALWRFDNDYKKTKTINPDRFTLNRIHESIMFHTIALKTVPAYTATEEGFVFKSAVEHRKLNEFIYYEIILPDFPDESLKFSEDQINKLVDYVISIRGESK